jgi:hypothetical protein
MKRLLLAALLVPLAAAAEPDAAFAPLAFLAGHCWKGTFPDGKQTDEHCFSWLYEGRFLRDTHTVRATGRPDYVGESTYFFDTSAKRLEYLYIENKGGFSRGLVSTDGEALVFPATAFVSAGKTQHYRARWQRSGDGAYDVITELQPEAEGAWKPWFKTRMEKADTRP